MNEFQIVTTDQLGDVQLKTFLDQVYPPEKSDFLAAHGAWWHRGNENRWATLNSRNEVVAYCAVIPTTCMVNGTPQDAIWWVDLIVLPEYRGLGLQHDLDIKVREAADLILGFPNELAARIHLKHGWGVRDDLRYMVMPLIPTTLNRVQRASGLSGFLIRLLSYAVSPLTWIWRKRLANYSPHRATRVEVPDPESLTKSYIGSSNTPSTYRDAEFLTWRYVENPYRSELSVFVVGKQNDPTIVLISRTLEKGNRKITRILDIFGNLEDKSGVRDIFKLAVRDAVLSGSTEISVIVSDRKLAATLKSIGFLLSTTARFCWYSNSQDIMQGFKVGHWTLADSDNDAP